MTHIELISLINKHKKVIDQAYRGEMPSEIDAVLFEAEIFSKIGDRIVLSEAYIQFINTMLKRVEYGTIFGEYAKELRQLVEYRKRFLDTNDKTYLNRIIKGIEEVYQKFKRRDSDVGLLISKIVHENTLNLEVILDDAENILSQIQELSKASTETYEILSRDIVGLSADIDDLLIDVKIDIQIYSENLQKYISRLNGFILRTKQRKEQNNKIAALAQKIMDDNAYELEALLRSNQDKLHHTLEHKRGKIKTVPSQKDLDQERFGVILRQSLFSQPHKVIEAPKTIYTEQKVQNIVVVDYNGLLRDIQNKKPEDLFEFIVNHDEIDKLDTVEKKRSEAFKAFLMTVSEYRQHAKIENGFGSHKVRRVRWI